MEWDKKAMEAPGGVSIVYWKSNVGLELGAGGYESLACGVVLKLLEVVDEHLGELGCLLGPLCGVCVGVARVENLGVNAGKLGGHGEVEDGYLLGGSGEDCAVKDSVDDATGILDGDALA